MKKILVASILCVLLLISSMSAFAAGLDDWTNLPGYVVDGTQTPAKVTVTSSGIQYSQQKGVYAMDGKDSGLRYNSVITNLDGFSTEIKIDTADGLIGNIDTQTWVSLQLNNKDKFFNFAVPTMSSGLLFLFQVPAEGSIAATVYNSTTVTPVGTTEVFAGNTVKVSLKKDTDGTYAITINDKKIGNYNAAVLAKGANLIYSASSLSAKPIKFTIKNLNGESLAAPAAASTGTANPATGDASMMGYAVAAIVACGAGITAFKKMKRTK